MPKVKPPIAKTFDFFQSVIPTLQNAGHYNNYNKNIHTFFVYPKRSLNMFDYSVVNKVVEAIVADLNPRMIVIFGSVAKGCATDTSDIDVMVVMDTDRRFVERSFPIQRALIKRKINVDRDIFVVTPEEFGQDIDDETSLVHEAFNTGYVVYEV